VVQTETRALDLPLPALLGRHQIDNAGLACVALSVSGVEVREEAYAAGVETTVWPARLQPLVRGPFSAPIRAAGGEVWVDGGHNAEAATALARALNDMKARRGGENIIIIGLRKRKDAAALLARSRVALIVSLPCRSSKSIGPHRSHRLRISSIHKRRRLRH
jgi:dihydrofolate synthase/folylpolyglutamate synthase